MFNRCSVMDLGTSVISTASSLRPNDKVLLRGSRYHRAFDGHYGCLPFTMSQHVPSPSKCGGSAFCWHYGAALQDGDRTTMKVIRALVECSASPSDNINDIFPNGHAISPLNPKSRVVAGVLWFLISGRSRLKQYSYKTSEAKPPSTYMRCMRWHPISTLVTIGLSCPYFSSGGNEISGFVEKL
ncbi:hypothetical protein Tco_1335110 [Tanacetum coccineum]